VTKVDELLDEYSLTRENARAYVDAIVRLNQTKAADEMGVHRKTVENYKNRFAEMSEEERAFVIAALFDERHRELL
jgi:predicted DNA-binding protein (UPF0251 family)